MKFSNFRAGEMLAVLLSATLSCAIFSSAACATESKNATNKPATFKQSYTWYDGNRERKVWLNTQLVAEFNPDPQGEKAVKSAYANAKTFAVRRKQTGIRIWQLDDTAGVASANIKARHPQGKYSPVLHDGASSDSRMRALPGNVIVYFDPKWDEKTVNSWLSARKFEAVKKLGVGPNVYVIKTGPGLEALDIANALYRIGEVKAAFPDWWQEVTTR
ncbi:MAG: hypothetical protein OEV23_03970 [Gallionella sp.]|nr:hypothetical protein [Gallionella sp.]